MRGGTTTGADFREARRHEHELSERQREVLALVSEGLTNAEIGERLGMTLDGAKWNVSEILTKLGLASREEAAEYWRWRHGGLWSRLQGWMGAPLPKVAGAGAAAVVGVGVVAGLMSEDEAPVVDEPGRPFYLEAEYRVTSNARTIGTNIAGATPEGQPETSRGVFRWSWQDVDHFRAEFEATEPTIDAGRTLIVGDGEKMWVYRETDAIYSEDDLFPVPDGYRVRPVSFSLLVGPLPMPDDVDSVDEFVAALGEWNPDGDVWARIGREEQMLGRRVVVIETGPVGCAATAGFTTGGRSTPSEECDGAAELWLDPERMLVLRHVGGSGDQSFEATVTRLDYDTDFEPGRFEFEPPPGAVPEVESSGGGVIKLEEGSAPRGFLRLDGMPDGYNSVYPRPGIEGSSIVSFEQQFRGPEVGPLNVSQRKRAMPEGLKMGEEHEVRGLTVYSSTTAEGWNRLAWEEAGVTVVLEAESMPVEHMLAIAESMELVE